MLQINTYYRAIKIALIYGQIKSTSFKQSIYLCVMCAYIYVCVTIYIQQYTYLPIILNISIGSMFYSKLYIRVVSNSTFPLCLFPQSHPHNQNYNSIMYTHCVCVCVSLLLLCCNFFHWKFNSLLFLILIFKEISHYYSIALEILRQYV